MRVLLLGSRGMLGHDLEATAPPGVALHQVDREQLDITDAEGLASTLGRSNAGFVINASGYTAVDRAETERDSAFAVNSVAVATLGRHCARLRIPVVHFSTDYVFGGTSVRPYREEDAVAPLNAYAESKLAGEKGLLDSGADVILVRTQWLFGQHGRSFPRAMWERALKKHPTRVVSDQVGRPTFTRDLARATWALMDRGSRGVFHIANSGVASWYELASHVFATAGVPELLSACDSSEYPTAARRPRYSVLDTAKAEQVLGSALPHWKDALDRFLVVLSREQPPATPSHLGAR